MLKGLDARSVAQFHDAMLADADWPLADHHAEAGGNADAASRGGAWPWVRANHRFNCLLWREEDKARRTDVDPAEIAASKRLIDQHNQKRNDAVEAVDEAILAALGHLPRTHDARLSSETAGAMIDRLSILSLKIFHMREQSERTDADAAHIDRCRDKLQRLKLQRADLASCLDQLLADARAGRAYFKVYRQFKMYNDPTLNPYLYGRRDASGSGKAAP